MEEIDTYLSSLGYEKVSYSDTEYSYYNTRNEVRLVKGVDYFRVMYYHDIGITIYTPRSLESVVGYIKFNIKD